MIIRVMNSPSNQAGISKYHIKIYFKGIALNTDNI